MRALLPAASSQCHRCGLGPNVERCQSTKSGPTAMKKRSICMQPPRLMGSSRWYQTCVLESLLDVCVAQIAGRMRSTDAYPPQPPGTKLAGTKCNRRGTKLAQPPQHTTPKADAVCEYVKCPAARYGRRIRTPLSLLDCCCQVPPCCERRELGEWPMGCREQMLANSSSTLLLCYYRFTTSCRGN